MKIKIVSILPIFFVIAVIISLIFLKNAFTNTRGVTLLQPKNNQPTQENNATDYTDALIRFTDVAQEVGINHTHHLPKKPEECLVYVNDKQFESCQGTFGVQMVAAMGGGVAVGDYDNDGWQDLFFTQADTLGVLYRNNGGKYDDITDVSGIGEVLGEVIISGNGAAWVDIDNDGDLDLYVTSIDTNRHYLFVNEDGKFREKAVARGADIGSDSIHYGYSIAVGDYNRDGWADLFVTEWRPDVRTSHARLLENRGAEAPGYFVDATKKAGLNNGRFIFRHSLSNLEDSIKNNPDTLYSPAQMSFSASFVDMDNDGWQDLLIAGDFGSSRVFWNNNGQFEEGTETTGAAREVHSMGSSVGDINNDGLLDWFVTAIYDPALPAEGGRDGHSLYQNKGTRIFEEISLSAGTRYHEQEEIWGWGTAMFDYNNDGYLDLAMTSGGINMGSKNGYYDHRDGDNNHIVIWKNNGNGDSFTNMSRTLGVMDGGRGRGVAILDYDNDGDADLLVVNVGQKPLLYTNNGGNQAGNWLKIKVDGIGARVVVKTADRTQTREVGSITHFLGQSERVLHFGFGSEVEMIDSVIVSWPATGREKTFTNVLPGQTIEVNTL